MLNREIPRATRWQLSLFELFFVTTLFAVGLGVYVYISPLLAMLAGGLWIVIATVSTFSPSNLVVGGLLGFATASALTLLMATIISSDVTTIGLAIVFPSVGYFCGACAAGFRDDSI